jgi:hypothetical protein
VGNVKSDEELEAVRDVLDALDADYEHVDSEPEDSYPQTAYFQISSNLADDVDNVLSRLSEQYNFDAEIL